MANYSKKFLDYLEEIGEIPKGTEIDLENHEVYYRYIIQMIMYDDGTTAQSPIRHGEVFVDGESIGYFVEDKFVGRSLNDEETYKEYQDVNWFSLKYLYGENSIHRLWDSKHIWCERKELD